MRVSDVTDIIYGNYRSRRNLVERSTWTCLLTTDRQTDERLDPVRWALKGALMCGDIKEPCDLTNEKINAY